MFARLLREAIWDPYVLDDVAIVVPHPTDEQIASLDRMRRPIDRLRALSGDAFSDLWELCRGEHIRLVVLLADEIAEHYNLTDVPPGGWAHWVDLCSRYGEAIEFDLWDRGDDLHDYFRGLKPWRRLLNVLDRLPANSQYVTAQRNDPELAELIASLPEAEMGRWRPPATEFSLDTSLLAEIRDRLGVVATLLGDMPLAPGVKRRSKPPPPFPRPLTAIERARAAAEAQMEADLDDMVAAAHATYEAEQQLTG